MRPGREEGERGKESSCALDRGRLDSGSGAGTTRGLLVGSSSGVVLGCSTVAVLGRESSLQTRPGRGGEHS